MKISARFVWRDLWVGVYIQTTDINVWVDVPPGTTYKDMIGADRRHRIYICLLPMCPVVIEWQRPLLRRKIETDPPLRPAGAPFFREYPNEDAGDQE